MINKNSNTIISIEKRFVLFSLLLIFSVLTYGQTKEEIEKLENEKVVLQQKIDSLYERIDEIDKLLGQDFDAEDRLEALVKKYGKNKGPMIAEGRVWVGVSQEMALDSWGEPDSRKKSEGSCGVNETWYYPEGKYIYFENGRLAKWKD
jgi:hypothetical protein